MRTHQVVISGAMLCLTLVGVALTSSGCAGTRYQRSTGAFIDDKGITTRVKTALFRDPNVSGFDVHVDTFRGDVQLSGFVDTQEQKEHAASLARQVSGVQEVTNNIEVKPTASTAVGTPGPSVQGSSQTVSEPAANRPAADNLNNNPAPVYNNDINNDRLAPQPLPANPGASSNLAPEQQPNLNANPSVSATVPAQPSVQEQPLPNRPNIDISGSNGRITLRGTATSEQEKRSIAQSLLRVPGVISVDNQLQVKPAAPANK